MTQYVESIPPTIPETYPKMLSFMTHSTEGIDSISSHKEEPKCPTCFSSETVPGSMP